MKFVNFKQNPDNNLQTTTSVSQRVKETTPFFHPFINQNHHATHGADMSSSLA